MNKDQLLADIKALDEKIAKGDPKLTPIYIAQKAEKEKQLESAGGDINYSEVKSKWLTTTVKDKTGIVFGIGIGEATEQGIVMSKKMASLFVDINSVPTKEAFDKVVGDFMADALTALSEAKKEEKEQVKKMQEALEKANKEALEKEDAKAQPTPDTPPQKKEAGTPDEFVCSKCGKVCKTKAGLSAHLRVCKG